MNHVEESLIHDFVDDELAGEERSRVAGHLAECVSCRAVASSARSVRDEAMRHFRAADEGTDAPDQWPAIAARIRSGASKAPRREFFAPRRAAAAVILLALSSGATWALLRSPGEVALAPAPESIAVPVDLASLPVADAIAGAYAPVFAELERILSEERGRLQPETLATMETNIAILNQAIAEIQAALAADPANRGGLKALDGMYQAKLAVLRRVVTLSPEV